VMILWLERLLYYSEEHPSILQHVARNCAAYNEEFAEFLNAKVGLFQFYHFLSEMRGSHFILNYSYVVREVSISKCARSEH
jgi:hypothetical protein